jgi:mycoredoxin
MRTQSTTADLTVFGADWCPDCRRSKRLLDRLGIDYEYVDLESEPERTAEVVRRNAGRQAIPVVVFPDDTHLTEPSDPALTSKLREVGLLAA